MVTHRLKINGHHLATPQAAHGALVAGMMDQMLGVAALSAVCEEDKIVSTIEFKLNFMNPAFMNDELEGVSIVEQKGQKIIVSSGIITAKNSDKIIARALGTFNAYPAERAGY